MSGRLTTHVLDTAHGRPAAGVSIVLRRDGEVVARAVTNADGRTDGPLLEGEALVAGRYELTFGIGAYFGDADGFLGEVPVRFRVADAGQHYHVPLLASPFAYSTYRGS
jgi:5-hydroxyisourate hydrolase